MKRAGAERPLRVVVVDDHEDTRDMTAELLEAHGFEVRACACVTTALVEIRADRPDVLVTDLQLGHESGVDLAVAIRSDASGVLVVAVTGAAHPDEATRDMFDAYCVKPIDIDAFVDEVRRLVRHRDGPTPPTS